MSDLTPAERAAAAWFADDCNHEPGESCTVCDKHARQMVEIVRPHIIAEHLGDIETEHIIEFAEGTFTIQHPLFDCQLHADMGRIAGSPMAPGRYRVIQESDHLHFEPLWEPPYAK